MSKVKEIQVPARDGYPIHCSLFGEDCGDKVVLINSATAVPRSFYRHYAQALVEQGFKVLTYDYRGIGESRPKRMRGFQATMRDWALQDMAGVVDWIQTQLQPSALGLVGHSVGGQMAGLLDNAHKVDAMMTFSSQSGYWALQGGEQKYLVCIHAHLTLPLISHAVGYMPWRWLGASDDLPKGVALEWAGWCRNKDYLLGDRSLPLDRYHDFQAEVLAYSFADDKWGTPRSVDAMMGVYPKLERRHVDPIAEGVEEGLQHFGFFRPYAKSLWQEGFSWMKQQLAG